MQHDNLFRLIQWHLDHHKNVGIQDIYKMLYQGVFGAEHLLSDVSRAKTYLEKEWQRVPADQNKNLLEPVSIDGKIVRVNIQRCKAEGITVHDLWKAFFASVPKVYAEKAKFENMWGAFVELCRAGKLSLDADEVFVFGAKAKENGWPAKHHTPAYREANYPAYRVVLKSEFEQINNIDLDEKDNFS